MTQKLKVERVYPFEPPLALGPRIVFVTAEQLRELYPSLPRERRRRVHGAH